MTVSRANYQSLEDSVVFCADMGFKYIVIGFAVEDLFGLDDRAQVASTILAELESLRSVRNRLAAGVRISLFDDPEKIIEEGIRLRTPCGAARSYVGIVPNGDIYACHRFMGDETHRLGNASDFNAFEAGRRSAAKRLNLPVINERKKCMECWAHSLCGGICYHDRKRIGEEVQDGYCDLRRAVYSSMIKNLVQK
jgi:radical SAM protein with 4Fe4S-binding SPASM domain